MSQRATRIVVVIPARDEQDRLGICLSAVDRSAQHLFATAAGWETNVEVHIVLDCCSDGSAALARRHAGVTSTLRVAVHDVDHGKVGTARDTGVRAALEGAGSTRRRTWIACTDADSRVPPDWLHTHLEVAQAGAQLMLGTIRLDSREITPIEHDQWRRTHPSKANHRYVYGANLGIDARTYVELGGFAHVRAHEDVRLAVRARQADVTIEATARSPVLTSARRSGRAPSGLAGYLRDLHAGRLPTGVYAGEVDSPATCSNGADCSTRSQPRS